MVILNTGADKEYARQYYLVKIAKGNGLTEAVGLLTIPMALFFGLIFGVSAVLIFICLFTAVFLFTRAAVEKLSNEQITAVILHELGHFVNRDLLKKQLYLLLIFLSVAFLVIMFVTAMFPPETFFLLVITLPFLVIAQPWMFMWYSRKCEYRADNFCASHGYGSELISSLSIFDSVNGMPSRHPEGILYLHPDLQS